MSSPEPLAYGGAWVGVGVGVGVAVAVGVGVGVGAGGILDTGMMTGDSEKVAGAPFPAWRPLNPVRMFIKLADENVIILVATTGP